MEPENPNELFFSPLNKPSLKITSEVLMLKLRLRVFLDFGHPEVI